MFSKNLLSSRAIALAILAFAAQALAAAPQVKLTPKDSATYIIRSGLKSADFSARGMAYRALQYDKGNKEVKAQLEDGMQDPQWIVRKGIAEAMYALKQDNWKKLVHDALAMPVLSPYEVLPVLDDMADPAQFALLIEVLGDKEHQQHDKIVKALVDRNRPNLGGFFKAALAAKDPLVQASALKGIRQLDAALQQVALETVAKAQPANEDLIKALVDVASRENERLAIAYLAPLKTKDAGLAAKIVALRAMHGDKSVGKMLLKIAQGAHGKEQIDALSSYKRILDKADADQVKAILSGTTTPELLFAVYEILARMGDRSMAKEAQTLADSTDVDVRATGVFYLGWVGGAGRISEMHGYLADRVPMVRVAATRVLGYIGSKISVEPIRNALDREGDEMVRLEFIKSLCQIKDKAGYEALMLYTREKDPEVRRLVVKALAESGEAMARPGLQNALNDTKVEIRTEAVRGFILSDVAEAIKVWRRSLKWLPRGTVIELTRELNKTMDSFLEIAMFDAARDEQGFALREEALIALHMLPEAELRVLGKLASPSNNDQELRVRAILRLWDLQGKKVATELKTLAMASDARARVPAIRLLAKLKGDKEAADMLVKDLEEPDERIRIAAALTILGG